ncbi:TonB family protein [Leptospira brenneri]|nr:TonB family protein [Leptospira brenneri]
MVKFLLILLFLSSGCTLQKKSKTIQVELLTNAADLGNIEILKNELRLDPDIIDMKNEFGFTALMVAAQTGNLEIAKELIQRKANLNLVSNNNLNSLLYAALYGHKDILNLLIENNAIDNLKVNERNALSLYTYLYETDSDSTNDNYEDYVIADTPPIPVIEINVKKFHPEVGKWPRTNKVVVLYVEINEKGILKSAKVVSGSDPIYNNPALEIIKRIRFLPAYNNGVAVKARYRFPILFD